MTTVNTSATLPIIITDNRELSQFFGAKLPVLQNVFKGRFGRSLGEDFYDAFGDGLEKSVKQLRKQLQEKGVLSPSDCYNMAYTCTQSEILDFIRSRNAQKNGGGVYHDDIHAPQGAADGRILGETLPAAEALSAERAARVNAALITYLQNGNFSRKERVVLYLRFGRGWQFKEIGKLEGLTQNNAKVVVHRAQPKLQGLKDII